MKSSKDAQFRFYRAGGLDQLRIESGADIAAVAELDQKLWLALSCPVKGLQFDERTLELLDTDHDGRVRAPEIVAAVQFVKDTVRNLDELTKGRSEMPLGSIKDSTDRGKLLLAAAKRTLAAVGKADELSISLDDVAQTAKIFAETRFNGDGIISEDVIGDPDARDVFGEVVGCMGGVTDAAGRTGIDQATLDAFFAELDAYSAWWQAAEDDAQNVLPLGDDTAAAFAAVAAVRTKVDDFFARVRLAEFDPRALSAVNRKEEEYLELVAKDMSITADEVAGFPLARVDSGSALPLNGAINPAWADRVATLKTKAIVPLVGERAELSAADWGAIKAKLAGYEAWVAAKKGAVVEKLGRDRVRAIVGGSSKENLSKLIAKDVAAKDEVEAIADVERLIRYYRDLHPLLNNFVSFTDFYRRDKAIFQAGELYLDSRRCDLCIKVDDVGAHSKLALLSKTYLAYCNCTRPSTGEKMIIAAAFTNGDSDELMVGRNGLFYDRNGNDWDATIAQVIDNPISIRQAFWSPYKKLIRWVEETVAKKAADADKSSTDKLIATAAETGEAATTGKAEKKKIDVGTVAALGVAVGGITAALAGLFDGFAKMGPWMPLGILGIFLAISGPSMLIAWLKLRQRSLGPILEGNGWAVNGRVKLNIPLGAELTRLAELPPNSERSLTDPYAKKSKTPLYFLITLVVLALLGFGLDKGGVYDVSGKLDQIYASIKSKLSGEEPAQEDGAADGQPDDGESKGGASGEGEGDGG